MKMDGHSFIIHGEGKQEGNKIYYPDSLNLHIPHEQLLHIAEYCLRAYQYVEEPVLGFVGKLRDQEEKDVEV
jgi:hypothetical protein